MGYDNYEIIIRSYDPHIDRIRVEYLERKCEIGSNDKVFFFTDTLGDPICRIRNSPLYNMLVAEIGNELVGVIQGTIKLATVHQDPSSWSVAKVGYMLGLRVAPVHRRKGIGSTLVKKLEEWFMANDVDYSYMATEKDNKASIRVFIDKLGYRKFRTPGILVNPVNHTRLLNLPSNVVIQKIKTEEAENLYRRFMGSTEFFPDDIDRILRNKLSLGTWVAYPRGESLCGNNRGNWAMLSVWNSGEIFKLRAGKANLSCFIFNNSSKWVGKYLSCLGLGFFGLPDFFQPFGFYFIYGVYREGSFSGKLVRALCRYVHNLAAKNKDCKIVVTEVAGDGNVLSHIPHCKLLSCPEDLWCIKALKPSGGKGMCEKPLTKMGSVFVDPREV